MDITTATRLYVQCASNDSITEPVGGTWMSAYAIYLGATEPVNGSWLQTVCIELGITQPVNNSWIIALAGYYGITAPVNGTWMNAIQDEVCNGVPTILVWNLVTTLWDLETTQWATLPPPSIVTWLQDSDLVGGTATMTGTATAGNKVDFVVDSQTITTIADVSGNWSLSLPALIGTPSPGTNFAVSITQMDAASGLLSTPYIGSINILLTTKTITFELATQWSLYWYYAGMQVEQETTPGNWTAIEYEGNPTWDNGSIFYKVQPLVAGGVSAGYQTQNVMSFRSGDESGADSNGSVFRDIILDLGFNYRIVGVNISTPNNTTNYGRFSTYIVYDGAIEILPLYDGDDVDWLTGNIQQTFTL